jgi:hypothetical protein
MPKMNDSGEAVLCDCKVSGDDKRQIQLTLDPEILTEEQRVPCPSCGKIFLTVRGRRIVKVALV